MITNHASVRGESEEKSRYVKKKADEDWTTIVAIIVKPPRSGPKLLAIPK